MMTAARPARPRLRRRGAVRLCAALLLAALVLQAALALALLSLSGLLAAEPPSCAAAADAGCAPAVPPADLDVVAVVAASGCVATAAVASLNRFVNPRRVVLLARSSAACAALRALAANVECVPQDELVPGVTHAAVAALLHRRYGLPHGATHYGRDTAGWYLQQLLKLGAADAAALNLTARFLLWDGDMVALAPVVPFLPDGRALRHVGGKRIKTYGAAYAALTGGERLAAAPDGTSFVTHAMAVERRHMRAMLAAFAASSAAAECAAEARGAGAERMPAWAAAVLCALPRGNAKALHLGFSEYASYASWTAAHAPADVALAPRRVWTRHPAGGAWAVAAQRWLGRSGGECCPGRRLLAATAARGWLYTGFETGHVARVCGGARTTSA